MFVVSPADTNYVPLGDCRNDRAADRRRNGPQTKLVGMALAYVHGPRKCVKEKNVWSAGHGGAG